MMCM